MGLIVLVWAVGFGGVSRRFEWQADLFGARSVTPGPEECDQPCLVHGTAVLVPTGPDGPSASGTQRGEPVCASAALLFAGALQRIADLNGIPVDARSWRHSSISNRMRLLQNYAVDPLSAARLERSVAIIKAVLLAGTVIGLTVAVWLYWPTT
jgi:STE24 endopeptidase